MGEAVTAIIPAFNEEVSIGSVVLRARQHADSIIVIDNGSTDRTSEVAQLAGAEVIHHPHSEGAALKIGIEAASQKDAKIIIVIDPDCLFDNDIVPKTIDPIKNEGYDIVVGSWRDNKITHDKEKKILLNNKASNIKISSWLFQWNP